MKRALLSIIGGVWLASCATSKSAGNNQKAAPPSASAQSAPAAPAPSQQSLVPYSSPGNFSVLAPANITHSQQTRDTPQGPVEIHISQASDSQKGINYLISYSKFPVGALGKSPPNTLLTSERDQLVKSVNGQLVSTEDINVAGMPGMEFTADSPANQRRVSARIIQGKDEVYTLVTSYPPGAEPVDAQQFLQSFRVTQPSG